MENKQHYKLYKNGKFLTNSLVVTAAVTGGMLVAQNQVVAHADEGQAATPLITEEQSKTTNSTVTLSQTPSQELVNAKQAVQVAQSAADETSNVLQKSANELNTAKNDVANKEANVKVAKTIADQAQKSVDEAEKTKNEATSENINKAQQSVTDSQQLVEQSQSSLSSAKNKLATAQQNLNNAKEIQQAAQDKVTQAQRDVDNAQQILDGAGINQAQTAAATAQTDYNQAINDLDKANENKRNAESANESAQQKLLAANQQIKPLQDEVNQANNQVNQKQAVVNEAKKQLTNAENDLSKAKQALGGNPVIDVTPAYVTAVKDMLVNLDDSKLSTVSNELFAKYQNAFVPSEQDKQTVVSSGTNPLAGLANLTFDQRKDLSVFAVALINQVRQQLGYAPMNVNAASLDVADYAANSVPEMIAHNYGNGYVASVIAKEMEKAAEENAKVNIEIADVDANSYGSDKYGLHSEDVYKKHGNDLVKDGKITLASLKQAVYDNVVNALFNDAENDWHQTKSLLAQTHSNDLNQPEEFVGVDFNRVGGSHIYVLSNIGKVIRISTNQPRPVMTLTYDNSKLGPSYKLNNLDDLKSSVKKAQANVDNHQKLLSSATNELLSAKNSQRVASEKLAQAQANLANATKQANQAQQLLVNAHQAVNEANDKVDQTKKTLAQANRMLSSMSSDQKNKVANLNLAKDALAKAMDELNTANMDVQAKESSLSQVKNELAKAKENLVAAQNQLQANQAYLSKLQSADANFDAAQQVLKEAQAKLAAAKASLENAQQSLVDAQSVYNLAKEKDDQAQAAVLAAKDKVKGLSLKVAQINSYHVVNGQVVDKNNHVVTDWKFQSGAMVDNYGNVISVSQPKIKVDNVVTQKTTLSSAKLVNNAVNNSRTLPQTGNQTAGALSLAGMAVMAMLGLGFKRREF